MNNKNVKMNTPPPKILRVVGKYRFITLVLALLFCCSLLGCSSSNSNEIYLANAYKYNDWKLEDCYQLYFNYIYDGKSVIPAECVKMNCITSPNIETDSNFTSYPPHIMLEGNSIQYGENTKAQYITPNMSITVICCIEKYLFDNIKTIYIELYDTEYEPLKTVTIAKKTFTQAELNKQLQTVLKGE